MSDNEMLSHIFLNCIPYEQLKEIRDKFIGEKDWQTESVTIPVELSIGGVSVNPKKFFDIWRDQMQSLIMKRAQNLVAEKLGSKRLSDMQRALNNFEEVLKYWENDINWDVDNPFNADKIIDDEESACPECNAPLVEKWSGVKCSECGHWKCF